LRIKREFEFASRNKAKAKFVHDVTWAQVPSGPHKKELLENLDRVPTYVQQLQFTVKNPTVGKAATFTKVDNVIQETKNLMNVISKVVTTCFDCATKVSRENARDRVRYAFDRFRGRTRHLYREVVRVTRIRTIRGYSRSLMIG